MRDIKCDIKSCSAIIVQVDATLLIFAARQYAHMRIKRYNTTIQ